MSYDVKFGKSNLSDYCTVLNVKRSLLPSRSNFSKQVPGMNGSYYTGGKYDEKVIELEIAVYAKTKVEYAQKLTNLANILNTNVEVPIIISDEPYKVYYGIVDGQTDMSKKFQNGTATIKIVCHDPIAQSLYWNTYAPNGKNIFNVVSYGTEYTSPIIDIDFRNKGCFFQVTNYEGKTVLVGVPKDLTKPVIPFTDLVVEDNCELASSFTSISQSLLDTNRVVSGQYGVGHNGTGMVCTNFATGESDKWTGCAFKRNLGKNVSEFEVTIDLTFSSQGENYIPPPPQPPYVPPAPPTPPSKPDDSGSNGGDSCLGTYKVVNCGGLWINSGPNTSGPLYPMAPGTLIYPTEIQGNWAKHTHSNRWHTYTGWSSMRYLQKVSNSGRSTGAMTINAVTPKAFADEQSGIIEIYGYDQNGAKLFKLEVSDTNQFYEYVEPKIFIGDTLVLDDGKNVPSPRKEDEKDSSGNVTGQKEVASGVFGDFNDFQGKLIIKREKNTIGEDLWSCEIVKIHEGKVVKRIYTLNHLSNASYSKKPLNYLGVFIGRYGTLEPVSVMTVTNIKVKQLNMKTDEFTDSNVQVFEPGDHMQINFETGKITLNDEDYRYKLDIGSEFFEIPPGESQFVFATDAENTSVVCGFKDRFI